jgi:hypothetical protein
MQRFGELRFLHKSVHDRNQGLLIFIGQPIDLLHKLVQLMVADADVFAGFLAGSTDSGSGLALLHPANNCFRLSNQRTATTRHCADACYEAGPDPVAP